MLKTDIEQFKSAAIHELESGKNINELARNLGVTKTTLYSWWHKARRQ